MNHEDGFIGEDLIKDQPYEYKQTSAPTAIILEKTLEDEKEGIKLKTFATRQTVRFYYKPRPSYTFSMMVNFEFSVLWDPRDDGDGVKEYLLTYDIVDASKGHRTGRRATKGAFATINLLLLNDKKIAIGSPMTRYGLYEHPCGGYNQRKTHPVGGEREHRSIRDHARWRKNIPNSFPFIEYVELNVSPVSWVRGCYV